LLIRIALFGLGLALLASTALADPCEAPITGYRSGQTLQGTVRYVVDGDGICISNSADPKTWVEIRLADFFAPEISTPEGKKAKAALERIIRADPQVACSTFGERSYDRLIATCSTSAGPIGAQMRAAGINEGGRGR
jgi:micrococcal nuclease